MNLEGSLERVNQVEKLLLERRQSLIAAFQKAGLIKELKRFNRHVTDFQGEVNAIHELVNQPDRMVDASLAILQKMPEFQKFFSQNSMLASYFRLPGNGVPVDPAILVGLQSRASVEHLVQQQFGSAGVNLQKNTLSQMTGMETYLQLLKGKIDAINTMKADQGLPDYKGNAQKVKSFGQRLIYGINLQSVRASGIFPTTTDFGMLLGFQFTKFFQAGIGASYKIGWGENFQKMTISHQGVGLRTYFESRIKNSFFLSGGAEMNYRSQIREFDQLKDYSAWQKSALLGITKKFRVTNKLNGNMQLLFDFLYARHIPASQPVLFRIGYGL